MEGLTLNFGSQQTPVQLPQDKLGSHDSAMPGSPDKAGRLSSCLPLSQMDMSLVSSQSRHTLDFELWLSKSSNHETTLTNTGLLASSISVALLTAHHYLLKYGIVSLGQQPKTNSIVSRPRNRNTPLDIQYDHPPGPGCFRLIVPFLNPVVCNKDEAEVRLVSQV